MGVSLATVKRDLRSARVARHRVAPPCRMIADRERWRRVRQPFDADSRLFGAPPRQLRAEAFAAPDALTGRPASNVRNAVVGPRACSP